MISVMTSRAEAADMTDDGGIKTPDRLRRRASRLLSHLTARSDRLMTEGRILMDGTPDEVRNDERVIDAYLGTHA